MIFLPAFASAAVTEADETLNKAALVPVIDKPTVDDKLVPFTKTV